MAEENRKAEEIGLPKPYPDEALLKVVEAKARKGDPRAGWTLMNLREALGLDPMPRTPAREAKFKALVKKAADAGDPEAMAAWAHWLDYAPEGQKNQEEIRYWYLKAWDAYEARAKQGDVKAMVALSDLMPPAEAFPSISLHGEPTRGDLMSEWLHQAAEHGDPESMYAVGMGLMSRGGPEHLKWIQRSADAGYWRAMLQLAGYYAHGIIQKLNGEEPKPDPVQAWMWYDKAVEVTSNPQISDKYSDPDDNDNFFEGWPPRPGTGK